MRTTVPPGLAELTEIEAYVDFVTGAPESVRETLRTGFEQLYERVNWLWREQPGD